MRDIWDRRLEKGRVIFWGLKVEILREKSRSYPCEGSKREYLSDASRGRLQRIIAQCEDAGSRHYVVPDRLFLS